MMRRIFLTSLVALLAVPFAGAAELTNKKALNLEVAKQIAAAAEAEARKNSWNVAITILDDGGHLLYFQKMDGVQIGSIEVSRRKAESAVKFKRATKVFSDGVKNRVQLVQLPGSLAFEGGLPITYQGQVIGSIGVSGVTAEQDGIIAKAGVDALAKILGR